MQTMHGVVVYLNSNYVSFKISTNQVHISKIRMLLTKLKDVLKQAIRDRSCW